MLSFSQYLQYLEESKFRVTSETSSSDQVRAALKHPHHDTRHFAARDIHPDRHEDHEDLLKTAASDKNTWVVRGAIKNPHISSELLQHLVDNHPHEKVKAEAAAALAKRSGEGAKSSEEKPKAAKPKAEAPKATKPEAAPAKEAKPVKPKAEKKPSGGYKTEAGEIGDITTKRTYVTHNGKHIGTVESSKHGIHRIITSHGGKMVSTTVPDHDEGISTIKDWHSDDPSSMDSSDSPIRKKK